MINFYTPINFKVPPLPIFFTAKQHNQPSSTQQINQISCFNVGILTLVLFLSYICIELKYKKYKKTQAETQKEQVKTLERIWKLAAYKRELDSKEH